MNSIQFEAFSDELVKIAAKKEETLNYKAMAALPFAGAALGAGVKGLAALASRVPMNKLQEMGRGAAIGGGIGLGAAGIIGLAKLLEKADPKGKGLETAVKLAPAVGTMYAAMKDS